MSDKDKKECTTREGIWVVFNGFLYAVWFGAPVLLLVILMCGIVNGEFIYSLISLPLLALWVIITRITSRKYEKHCEDAAEQYLVENITEYTSDGGKLGVLKFEYDKKRNMSRLCGVLPPAFAQGEVITLTSMNERENGQFVESIYDRLFADRFLIQQGILNEYKRRLDEFVAGFSVTFQNRMPQAVTLEEVSIEDNSTKVFCKFGFVGFDSSVYAEVDFVPNVIGYNIWIESADYE